MPVTIQPTTLKYKNGSTFSSADCLKGDKGDTGATPALSIGTVTTGVSGSDASATMTGTTAAPVLNLTIPRGNSGDTGLIAPAYSSSSTYAVGDHVIYDDKYYVCTTAISTAEAWTAAHWSQLTVGSETSALKSAVANAVGTQTEMVWAKTDQYYINTGSSTIDPLSPYTYASSHHGKCNFMSCTPGDVFIISLQGNSVAKPYIFCASDGTVISVSDNTTFTNERIVAPENAAYVGFNLAPNKTGSVLIGEYKTDEQAMEISQLSVKVDDAIDEMHETVGVSSIMIWAKTDQYYIATNVDAIDTSSPYSYSSSHHGKCNFMACAAGDLFIISLEAANNYRPYVFCASDGTIISRGDNKIYTDARIIAPENAAYVGFNLAPNKTGSVQIGENEIQRLDYEFSQLELLAGSPYKGLSCVAFGTSLTERDLGYRPYLAELLGMTIDNQGVGSAFWYTWNHGTSNILDNVQAYASYSDKNVCIIEGCTNDWSGNRTLGTYKDTGTSTVCGCLYNMISHIYTQNANIQIIVIFDHFGRNYNSTDRSATAVNSDGKTQMDYYEECAKLCELYGIPCIKTYAESSIGIFEKPKKKSE